MGLIGIPIGFYGYLFPGNINIMVLELYASKKYKMLITILSLIVLFESVYCIGSLFYLNKIKTTYSLFSTIEMASYLFILAMGSWMLFEKQSGKKAAKNTFYRGLLSIIIHPQQIPFWILIGVVINPVMNFGMGLSSTITFMLCNAIGTLLVMAVYMVYGSRLMDYFKLKLKQLNVAIGVIYIIIAVVSLSKLIINF
jgi:small neutral amino acid transporter SnatA (MarC family)